MEEMKLSFEKKLAELKSKPKPMDIMESMALEDEIREIEVYLGIKSNTCSIDGEGCLSCGS